MDEDRRPLTGSEIARRAGSALVGDPDPAQVVGATILVRRRPGSELSREQLLSGKLPRVPREQLGADGGEMDAVVRFAEAHGLTVLESNAAERSVRVSGPASLVGPAFGVHLARYEGPQGPYLCYEGTLSVPASLEGVIQQVLGLDQSPVARR